MRSRNEMEFLRLLKQCQLISQQKEKQNDWRLEKYVDSLTEKLDRLREQKVIHLSRDTLETYDRKTQFLRRLIDTEKLPSAEKRLLAAELLVHDVDSRATYLINKNRYHKQAQDELFQSNTTDKSQSVKRKNSDNHDVSDDITSNILELTNNIRATMHAANDIIKKDTEMLSSVAGGADRVSVRMQMNTDRLSDFLRRNYQFWIWIALVIVTITFLMMVIFIRFFPKPIIRTRYITAD